MLPQGLQETLRPLLQEVESLTEKIKQCDVKIEQIARTELRGVARKRESGAGLLSRSTWQRDVECMHHVLHEPTTIEADARGLSTAAIAPAELRARECDDGIDSRQRSIWRRRWRECDRRHNQQRTVRQP